MAKAQVLVLEPDAILASNIQRYLQTVGYNAEVARDAQDAVMHVDKAKPDLVIMELMLASHSGAEFLYELRSYPEWQQLPVVIYTSLPPDQLDKFSLACKQLNVSKILYKPLASLRDLALAIDPLINVPV